jgi:chloramphenicol 3-O-phosphotransferase/RimJ/RimL family protein N-acetyltransferase
MIIFLNGASSVGKSTIARALMHASNRPFLYYSIDHLLNFWIDEKFVFLDQEPKDWIYEETDQHDRTLAHFIDGPHVNQLHWDMIDALDVLITKGYDIIIDEVLWDPEIFKKYIPALSDGKSVYLVKIICDLIECERREKRRNDRYQGFARASYAKVYGAYPEYDLEIDSTHIRPSENAQKIIEFTQSEKKPRAFLSALKPAVSFESLQEKHFGQLQLWMNALHLQDTWGENKEWTLQEIKAKYQTIVRGYKSTDQGQKPIQAFIILCAEKPIGYIQYYNAYDFPRAHSLEKLPESLAALDVYIGEPHFLNKGIGSFAIAQTLQSQIFKSFSACLVDPDTGNAQAIRAYEKAGFKIIKQLENPPQVWMLSAQNR